MGKELTMNFGNFEGLILLLSVIIVTVMIQKGRSTWLSGLMLLISYAVVAAAFFVKKDPAGDP